MPGRYASYWSYRMGAVTVTQFGFRLAALGCLAERRCSTSLPSAAGWPSKRGGLEAEKRRLEAEGRRVRGRRAKTARPGLHDEAGQCLVLVWLQLEVIERETPAALRARVAGTRAVAERAVEELRRLWQRSLGGAGAPRLAIRAAGSSRPASARFIRPRCGSRQNAAAAHTHPGSDLSRGAGVPAEHREALRSQPL